jgi:hypothetical protein
MDSDDHACGVSKTRNINDLGQCRVFVNSTTLQAAFVLETEQYVIYEFVIATMTLVTGVQVVTVLHDAHDIQCFIGVITASKTIGFKVDNVSKTYTVLFELYLKYNDQEMHAFQLETFIMSA